MRPVTLITGASAGLGAEFARQCAARDAARTAMIEKYGYRVLRFWNNDVLVDLDAVLEAIRQELLLARNRPE